MQSFVNICKSLTKNTRRIYSVQDQEGLRGCLPFGGNGTTLPYLLHNILQIILTVVSILDVCIFYTGLCNIYIELSHTTASLSYWWEK